MDSGNIAPLKTIPYTQFFLWSTFVFEVLYGRTENVD